MNNNFTYNIDDSVFKERNKGDYEREYQDATKLVLEQQKPIFKDSKFDANVFNRLFVQNNKQAHALQSGVLNGDIEEMTSTSAMYTEIDTGNTHNITSMGHASFSMFEDAGEPHVFTKEEIKKAKKQPADKVSKLSTAEINNLISKRNSEKLEFNTEPMKKPLTYDSYVAPPQGGGGGGGSGGSGGGDITTLNNMLLLEQTKCLNLQTKELTYKNEITDLKREIHKLKKLNTKLLEELALSIKKPKKPVK